MFSGSAFQRSGVLHRNELLTCVLLNAGNLRLSGLLVRDLSSCWALFRFWSLTKLYMSGEFPFNMSKARLMHCKYCWSSTLSTFRLFIRGSVCEVQSDLHMFRIAFFCIPIILFKYLERHAPHTIVP